MKKLLGKLFGGGDKASETVDTPQGQIQRSPRVRVPTMEGAVFVATNGKKYPLRNLSESGLALVSAGERFPDEMNGEIQISGEKVYVELVTARRTGDDVGATFGDGAAGVRGLLRRVFSDEFKALEMTEVESARQKAVEKGEPKWFYAPGNFELFYVDFESKLLRFELEWNGNVLALGEDGALRYGTVDQEAAKEAAEHAKSSLISWHAEVKPEHKLKALRLIENVPGLDGAIRKRMQELLS